MKSETATTYFGKSRSIVGAELKATEAVLCPICDLAPRPFATDYQGFQLCYCPKCRLQFVSPRLSFEQLSEKVYTDSYFPRREDTAQESALDNHQFGRQLSSYERWLGTGRNILDIGCGNGSFLDFAQRHGWEIFGADIGLSTDVRRLQCPLWEGRLQEIDFGDVRFDVIRFNHVLEHTQNPLAELIRSRHWVRPGGLIHVSVPNIAGVSARLKGMQSRLGLKRRRWRHYAAMHHLFFFSPDTLRLLIERAGLRVLHWETPVLKKSNQNALLEGVYRRLLEGSHSASILDFYCTVA